MDFVKRAVDEILRPFIEVSSSSEQFGENIGASIFNRPDFEEIVQINEIAEIVFSSEVDILGDYMPMSSPGTITLHIEKLRGFFWDLVKQFYHQTGFPMSARDLANLAHMVVWKTYTHEQFHHHCDVVRKMNGSAYKRLQEEALAVAWSHYQIETRRKKTKTEERLIPDNIFWLMFLNMYAYRQPGYRDWVNYPDKDSLFEGITQYLNINNRRFLMGSGVDLDKLVVTFFSGLNGMGVIEKLDIPSGAVVVRQPPYTTVRKTIAQMSMHPPRFVGLRGGVSGIVKYFNQDIRKARFRCSYDALSAPSSEWMTYAAFEQAVASIP